MDQTPEMIFEKKPPQLIAIVGGSGAGKSRLADRLQKKLGPNAIRLSLDDFYRDRSGLSPARREKLNFDQPQAIDWARLKQVLGDCAAGRSTTIPRYDFVTHTRRKRGRILKSKPLIIMDGLWLFHRPWLRRLFQHRIFIDCPSRLRLYRRVKRDGAERGRTAAAVRRQFRKTVGPMHRLHVAPQRKWASQVVSASASPMELRQLLQSLQAR